MFQARCLAAHGSASSGARLALMRCAKWMDLWKLHLRRVMTEQASSQCREASAPTGPVCFRLTRSLAGAGR